jgi:hypothetical protein
MFKPVFKPLSERLASLGLRAAFLCAPVVCMAQPVTVEPSRTPTVMTTQAMHDRIEKLSIELKAVGAYLTVGSDARLGCACGGGPSVPNIGGGVGPGSPLNIQHMVRALEAMQVVLNNERAGLNTTIYSTLPRAGAATALPN